jgi:hypothetical protein
MGTSGGKAMMVRRTSASLRPEFVSGLISQISGVDMLESSGVHTLHSFTPLEQADERIWCGWRDPPQRIGVTMVDRRRVARCSLQFPGQSCCPTIQAAMGEVEGDLSNLIDRLLTNSTERR